MSSERKIMQFYFISTAEISTHYHQNPELFYVLTGELEIRIDDQIFPMKSGDILLVNANKRHQIKGNEELLGARFEIDLHLLSEYMESMQLLFWCNTIADKNEAYQKLRELLNRILTRYFEKDEKGALYLNALYYETIYLLTSNFLIKSDDARLRQIDTQDRVRVRQIQNYIQANYQAQISLNDLASKLYLSNTYLSKYIKKHLGLTFMEYLNNVRLFHAVDELLYTKKNMTRIALDNGYPTSAAFTKAFRDIYGEAPSEYRKHMQEEQQASDPLTTDVKDLERIRRYLQYKERENEPEVRQKETGVIDASVEGRKLSSCSKAVCVGDAYTILHSDVQNQLKDLRSTGGIRYVRIWNIFSREECYDEKKGCNFRKIDLVLDFLIENQIKPYLELGHKKTVFMYTPERYLKQIQDKEFFDLPTYKKIIREFCTHLVNRYGVDEIESWFFELWNGSTNSENFRTPMLENDEYYDFFEAVYRTLKEISPRIQVGGAGFILGFESQECREVLRVWKKRKYHPDFLSVYSYQYVAFIEDGQKFGRKSIDIDYMKNQIAIFREIMQDADFNIPRLHVSEWNFTISNRNVINDSCEQGAYVLKNCIDMDGEVDLMAYWHALDSYSDYYDADMPLNGDSGMISRDGIYKPSFYAYGFFNKLLPNVLYKDGHSIVTSNGRDRFVIACHNFKKLSSRYVFTEEDEIVFDDIERYTEDEEPLNLRFRLTNVKNGNYTIKIRYVNKTRGSAQDIWKRLGYSKNLARDEMSYLIKSSIPCIETEHVTVNNNVLEFENVLLAQEIRMLEIQYQYSL